MDLFRRWYALKTPLTRSGSALENKIKRTLPPLEARNITFMKNKTKICLLSLSVLVCSLAVITPAAAEKPAPAHKQANTLLAQVVTNPAQVLSTCSYQVGTQPHELMLLKVDLPRMSSDDRQKFFNSLAPGQAKHYYTSMAYIVVDTLQRSTPKSQVVWGTYGTAGGRIPRGIQQKSMEAVVWDARTQAPYVVLAQSRELEMTIRVYKISTTAVAATLSLTLEYTKRLSWLENVAPLSATSVGTRYSDVNALEASVTPTGLSLVFQRERGYNSPVWDTPPYNTPVNVSFDLSSHQWSSPNAQIRSGRIEML